MSGTFRFPVRVRPGARAEQVGGTWGPDTTLLVAVSAPAVDGKANTAVMKAVARAFAVRPRQVRIVSGQTSRSKVVEIDGAADGPATLARLLAGDGDRPI